MLMPSSAVVSRSFAVAHVRRSPVLVGPARLGWTGGNCKTCGQPANNWCEPCKVSYCACMAGRHANCG